MPKVKFADCPCPPDEEAWDLTGELNYMEGDEGTDMVEFTCETCDTTRTITVPVERV